MLSHARSYKVLHVYSLLGKLIFSGPIFIKLVTDDGSFTKQGAGPHEVAKLNFSTSESSDPIFTKLKYMHDFQSC